MRFTRESCDTLDLGVISIQGKKQNIIIAHTTKNKKAQTLFLSKNIALMLIAGIQEMTLVDYPDNIACILFTPGCNLRCRFCHNPSLVLPSRIAEQTCIPEEVLFTFLESRKGLIDGVVISGGEPTLQYDLHAFCEKLKEQGFLVKLDTNGRDPKLLRTLIEQHLVDYIAMDIKIDEAQWLYLLQNKEKIHPYLESIQLLLQSDIAYEFRTTLIKPYHTLSAFTSMMQSIQGANNYYLQTFRSQETLDEEFDGVAYTPQEMNIFKDIAQTYVKYCSIR